MVKVGVDEAITKSEPGEMLQQVPHQPIAVPGCLTHNINGEPYQVRTGTFGSQLRIMFRTAISRININRFAILTTDCLDCLEDIVLHLHGTAAWATHFFATKVIC